MIINVICLKEEKREIQKCVSEQLESDADFRYNDLRQQSKDNVMVISHSMVDKARAYDSLIGERVYIYFARNLFNIYNSSELLILLERAVDEMDWMKAKAINELLIDIDFILKNTKSLAYPNYLQIETTSFCNAKCIMCSHYFSDNKGAACLKKETLDNMVDAVRLSHTISLNGMGEPFVSPYISEQIDYYAQYGNKIVTNTNLSVINDRLISQINACFEWLEISIDGATEKTYESIRKNLKLKVIKENLEKLKEGCSGIRKHIASVIMRQNVKEMPLMVELAYENGAQIITFMTLNSNIIIQNSQDEMCNYPKVLEYYSAKALEKGKKLGIPVIVPNAHLINWNITFEDIVEELERMESIPLFKSKEEEEQMLITASIVDRYLETNDEIQRDTQASKVKCSGICDWILKQSYIDLNGNVAMCCRNQSFHTGNVNDTRNFAEVWNGQFYQKLREIFYSGYVPQACLKCGLIESGNLKYLKVEITDEFYKEPVYKERQKETLQKLLKR